MHSACPVVGLYLPVLHVMHEELLVAPKVFRAVPRGQSMQIAEPLYGPYVPCGQAAQFIAPAKLLYLPGAQSLYSEVPY